MLSPSSLLESTVTSFVAGIPMVVLATFIVPKYLDWRKRPKLVITNRQTDGNVFQFEPSANAWYAGFEIGVQNDGLTAQRDWYWNLIIPESLDPHLTDPQHVTSPEPRREIVTDHAGRRWVRFMGKCADAIYPGRNYLFPYRVELSSAERQPDQRLYYFFGTEFGLSPAGARRLGRNLKLTPEAFSGCLGELVVKFPTE